MPDTLRSLAYQAASAAAPGDLPRPQVLVISDAVVAALQSHGVLPSADEVNTEILVEQVARVLLRNHLTARGLTPSDAAWEDFPSAQDLWRDQARQALVALHSVIAEH